MAGRCGPSDELPAARHVTTISTARRGGAGGPQADGPSAAPPSTRPAQSDGPSWSRADRGCGRRLPDYALEPGLEALHSRAAPPAFAGFPAPLLAPSRPWRRRGTPATRRRANCAWTLTASPAITSQGRLHAAALQARSPPPLRGRLSAGSASRAAGAAGPGRTAAAIGPLERAERLIPCLDSCGLPTRCCCGCLSSSVRPYVTQTGAGSARRRGQIRGRYPLSLQPPAGGIPVRVRSFPPSHFLELDQRADVLTPDALGGRWRRRATYARAETADAGGPCGQDPDARIPPFSHAGPSPWTCGRPSAEAAQAYFLLL